MLLNYGGYCPKKNGYSRITIDLQHLNSQCLRETHHTPSLFQIACQIPPNTKKSLLDAAGGFHAILLDKESQPMTTFNQLYYAAILQASQS